MTSVLAAARAVHFASAMLVFGELAFALFVAVPDPVRVDEAARRRFSRVAWWSIAASVASWLVWLGCEAAEMSGASVAEALRGHTLALVLGQTSFGWLWLVRCALAAVLAALLWSSTRPKRHRALTGATLAIAGAYLASLAWAGHAAAGSDRGVQLASDALHLLAAGGWVGALPALIATLTSDSSIGDAPRAVRRFSTLGVICVTALLVTGFVNAWYLVGDIPALVGTDYGRLLLVKLALLAAMLALANFNRFVLTPRLSAGTAEAGAQLRRNAIFEAAGGVGIVAIVGALGITIPGAHQSPVWPFSRGLDLEPAYPTSYATPPVAYTTAAIARGAALYQQQCESCHGAHGHGDGPLAASLPGKPANLAEHAAFHRAGDLFWFVAHGVPGTPMPAFGAKLSDNDIWSVVRFLRALSDGESLRETAANASAPRPIVAPDFVYEISGRVQESLARPAHREMTLLVFYTLPQSLPRLQALRADLRSYSDRAIRVVEVPMQQWPNEEQASLEHDAAHAVTSADVPTVYAMFARTQGSEAVAPHAEFLVDNRGFLRRRWVGAPDASAERTAEVLNEADAIAGAPPLAAQEKSHAH